jgi:uncharacterized protein (TIGR02231 family)
MKTAAGTLLTTTLLFIAAGSRLPAEEPTRLQSRIAEVTVYSDRARITREAVVKMPQGAFVLAFEELPGWIDESSLRASLLPAGSGRILDVRVQREYLAQATDEKLVAAEKEVLAIEDKVADFDDELAVLEAKSKQVENVRAFSMEKLPKDAALRELKIADYGAVVDYVTDEIRKIKTERRRIARERRLLEPELAAKRRKLNELKQLTQLEQTTVLVKLENNAPRNTSVTLTYMLPGATWESSHELRAAGATPATVALTSYAILRQTTGEDWSSAKIFFSTQSAGESLQIPEVDVLLLGGNQVTQARVQRKLSSFQRATKVFEGQNIAWYQFNNPNADVNDFIGNSKQQKAAQSRNGIVFRELRDRGTTARFAGEGKPMVRSDGNAVRVPIGKAELAAVHKIVAAPEVSLNAARIVNLKNTGNQPLLPGRTALFHDGAFLGQTDIDFVSSGEAFDVLFAIADQIKLEKTLDRRASQLDRGRKSTRMKVAFDIVVENLSAESVSLELTDRVPVSDDDAIEVERIDIEPAAKPDNKGLVKWAVALNPNEKRAYRIAYTIEYPREILLRRSQQVMEQNALPSAPALQMQEDISVQIENLEAKF